MGPGSERGEVQELLIEKKSAFSSPGLPVSI